MTGVFAPRFIGPTLRAVAGQFAGRRRRPQKAHRPLQSKSWTTTTG